MIQKKSNDDAIEVLKVTKKRGKYLVEITPYSGFSSEETFTESQLVDNRVFKGQIFLVDEWSNILKSKKASELFDKVLNYLSFGHHTEKEIRNYLLDHEASDEDIKKVINRLKGLNFLNDEVYAKEFLNQSINNHKGPLYIKNELKNKGIDNLIIEEVLAHYDDYQIQMNVLTIIKKELPQLNTYPINKQKEKIYQKLLRMGYSNSQIISGFNEVTFTSNHEERLLKEAETLLNKKLDEIRIKQKLIAKGYSLSEISKAIQKISEKA